MPVGPPPAQDPAAFPQPPGDDLKPGTAWPLILLYGAALLCAQPQSAPDSAAPLPAPVAPSAEPDAPVPPRQDTGAAVLLPPLTGKQRLRLWEDRTFASPAVYLFPALSAALWQWRGKPEEWRQGAAGFGMRFADRMGERAISRTTEAGLGALLGHEVRYQPSLKPGAKERTAHALASALVTTNRKGRPVFHISQVAAAAVSAFASSRWRPADYRSASTVARETGISVGSTALLGLLREFLPDLRRAVSRPPKPAGAPAR